MSARPSKNTRRLVRALINEGPEPERCVYCGARLVDGRKLACACHQDLLALDPFYAAEMAA